MGTVCNSAYSVRYLVYLVVALVRAEKMTRLCDYEMLGDYGVARALKPKTMAKKIIQNRKSKRGPSPI